MPETTFPVLEPIQRPEPRLGLDPTEIILLAMQVGSDVVAQKGEEGGDTEGFVTVAHHLKVDGVTVEEDTEPSDDGVNGDHE